MYILAQALFPDNTYGVDSGGDPKVIPKLTFEEFKVCSSYNVGDTCSNAVDKHRLSNSSSHCTYVAIVFLLFIIFFFWGGWVGGLI